MTDPIRTPKPERGPPDSDPSESTSVRPRPSSVRPSVTERSARPESGEWPALVTLHDLSELVTQAKILLAELPLNHPRARLLRTAIVRRDEIVLARLIEELRSAQR